MWRWAWVSRSRTGEVGAARDGCAATPLARLARCALVLVALVLVVVMVC